MAAPNGHARLVRLILSCGITNVASNGSKNPRLDEFKVKKEELDEYQRLDWERRAMEYTLYDKELRQVCKGLDKVKHARNKEANRLSSLHKEVSDMQERILAVEAKEKAKGNTLKRNAVYMRGLKNNRTLAMTHRTKLDLECRELEEQLVQGKEDLASNKK